MLSEGDKVRCRMQCKMGHGAQKLKHKIPYIIYQNINLYVKVKRGPICESSSYHS